MVTATLPALPAFTSPNAQALMHSDVQPDTHPHSIECTLVRIVAAVYKITDMIVFEIYKQIDTNDHYMVVTLQDDDINEYVSVFKWNEIPKSVMHIYYYLLATSAIERKADDSYVLYGTHIGRIQDHKYTLMTYSSNPTKRNRLETISFRDEIDKVILNEICTNMKIVKRLN